LLEVGSKEGAHWPVIDLQGRFVLSTFLELHAVQAAVPFLVFLLTRLSDNEGFVVFEVKFS
jgi:hypothetical protein